ncbi:unnamed protein product [marine sediment metagenome]|uniref:Metallo-beta-lactamase domain-containing protein n=1 Tax=marine sediment metagenome TaxID=412755 RepID=X1HEU0_9ZZZZ
MSDPPVRIETLALGPLQTNCYVLRAQDDCWVVDPAWPQPLLDELKRLGAVPSRILLTHGHGDHIAGAADLKAAYPDALLCCPAADADMLTDPRMNMSEMFGVSITAPAPDELIEPGQVLQLGPTRWEVLDTAGHTPGGVSYYCPRAGVVLTGDALFDGSIGRIDIPGASASRLLKSVRVTLMSLPGETRILSGHGPASTIILQKTRNPFIVGCEI